jgi:uncharacterized ion transporter superfamily protein YfcC
MNKQADLSISIGKRAFLSAAVILLLLMISAGILGRMVPAGSFEYRETASGRSEIIPGTFTFLETSPHFPVWRWITSPFELLAGPDGPMVIGISLFMLLIAGSISILGSAGILRQMVESAVSRWAERRKTLIAVLVLVFMLFGSFLGTMEESLVLVPLAVSLAVGLGWDPFMGAALSLGAMALGFSAAVTNPFTIGVAQGIAGLPPFSGAGLRLAVLLTTYLVYILFLFRYARRFSAPEASRTAGAEPFAGNGSGSLKHASMLWFGMSMIIMIISLAVTMAAGLSSLAFPLMVLFFLIAALGAARLSAFSWRSCGKAFTGGMGGIAPGILLVLMAAAVKQIMQQGRILDTLLHFAAENLGGAGKVSGALMMYALVLFLNFFISSGSAKAFLVMPIVVPLTDLVGIGRQTAVLAFMFGDGYSNILYPTNAMLLICLAMTGIPYTTWLKKILPLQLLLFIISVGFIALAALSGY